MEVLLLNSSPYFDFQNEFMYRGGMDNGLLNWSFLISTLRKLRLPIFTTRRASHAHAAGAAPPSFWRPLLPVCVQQQEGSKQCHPRWFCHGASASNCTTSWLKLKHPPPLTEFETELPHILVSCDPGAKPFGKTWK